MSDTSPQHPAKPGTACLGCRRRKLKCSREHEGCSNCLKSDLPCVYPAPETGVKRKRGPYRKDKAPRERHLEDLVKYLEPKASQNDPRARSGSVEDGSSTLDHIGDESHSPPNLPSKNQDISKISDVRNGTERKNSNSEDLVKDALIALTKSSVKDKEQIVDNAAMASESSLQPHNEIGGIGLHPPLRRIFEYWHLFESRVDPLLKVIHCPSFAKSLFAATADLLNVDVVTETLMFSIYYAAVSTCTAREVRKRFGESRDVLLQRYGRVFESALSDNYSIPTLGSLQALIIYIVCSQSPEQYAPS